MPALDSYDIDQLECFITEFLGSRSLPDNMVSRNLIRSEIRLITLGDSIEIGFLQSALDDLITSAGFLRRSDQEGLCL